MRSSFNSNKKEIFIITFIILFSFTCGIFSKDIYVGLLTLLFGFLNAYYMAKGKWINNIFGVLFSIFYSYACYKNGLNGFAIFTILLYTPLQIIEAINWRKHQEEKVVLVKGMNLKKTIVLLFIILCTSNLLALLLSIIPGQRLSYLDSLSQIINITGIIFITLRYKESWYIWLINNVIDLYIWILNVASNGKYSIMLLITSIMYLVMNVYGIITWKKIQSKQQLKHEIMQE